ncbi:MarR family winged helix-turn-helix transcriptional regulator [Denitromonas ohlonensis]|uniref:MarR family transcriptional regulator n=2 Tax=Denitromonas TaxID=139331 RepID=A0A557RE99_9RHOO|nr:MarR family transcriptional regulator [Denitromonas ohlonensis]TVO63505.1 MarR family transcriptional regulator [Denitromonas ohlonensis]TVO75382.1 MarR family transcriptional regulator [Denitromonas ohlonensis]TVT70619.1 MAG: MarR family transcriptional regulator [Denitromonas halophila]
MKGAERLVAVEVSTPSMARALPELPMTQTVMVRLLRIAVAGMSDCFEPVFRAAGLAENSFHILCLLMAAEAGSASPSELSDLVGTSRANITRLLDALVDERLVSRRTAARDARRQVVTITAQGRARCRVMAEQIAPPLRAAFGQLDDEELATLARLLRKAVTSFDGAAMPARAFS